MTQHYRCPCDAPLEAHQRWAGHAYVMDWHDAATGRWLTHCRHCRRHLDTLFQAGALRDRPITPARTAA